MVSTVATVDGIGTAQVVRIRVVDPVRSRPFSIVLRRAIAEMG